MNRVILSGRLTKDIEIKLTQTGTKVGNFSVAVNRKKQAGEEVPKTDFFNCVCFNKTAEFLEQWSGKGLRVEIEGRVQNRSWQDQQGQNRTVTEILVEQVEPIDWKKETQEETQPSYNDSSYNEPSYDVGDLPF